MIDKVATSYPTKIAHNKLIFNDDLEIIGFDMGMLLPKQALEYSDIIDYEIHQNGSSVSRGSINLARGIGMGLATNGLGLIVGLATGGKQKTKEVSENIEIFIKVNDSTNPTRILVTSAKKLKTDSKQYAQDLQDTQDIAATLDRIIKQNEERKLAKQLDQQKENASSSVDPLEEIAKLKKLLDMGAITQDEFEEKKKQLLDL
ncbi:SHOCT domain-containing protein [Ligilactobacillus agilis]|nr:SHOCT domain-containing protein [Ligilactobacillus agilis]